MDIYPNPVDDIQRVTQHNWKSHDIFHTLLDEDVSVFGEACVISFLIAQYPSPLPILLVSTGMINTAFKIRRSKKFFKSMIRGYKLGLESKNLVWVNWDNYWNKPLTEVRREFNLS